jgi:outer membrane protein OmpA-like peptidoglycan-associated protein
MERAVAVLVGGVGVVLLTLAGLAWSGPDDGRGGGVEVLALQPAASTAGDTRQLATLMGLVDRASPTETTAAATSSSATSTTVAAPAPPVVLPAAVSEVLARISAGAIRFEVARADLDDGARAVLADLAAQLRAHPDVVVLVRGHTDSTGTVEFNRELSVRRAQVVAEALVALGVPPHQLATAGAGPTEPIADNATPDGRQANRRSEVLDGRSP